MIKTLNPNQLRKISDIVCDNPEILFNSLDIRLYKGDKAYYGKCPIHCGDKIGSINIYTEGHSNRGYWQCYSHHCENVFKSTIIGFTRGILSRQHCNWKQPNDPQISFLETIDFICKTYGINIDNIEVDYAEIEKKKYIAQTSWSLPMSATAADKTKIIIKRNDLRSKLEIPSKYFLSRGFSREVLDKYDVGDCIDQEKPMRNRAVVPIYDEGYNYAIGCQGRSIFDQCIDCKGYHDPNLPCDKKAAKWLFNKNFNSKQVLYNYWFAKEYIKSSKTAILVESVGNTWRLWESGVYNVVALFGCELGDGQEFLLEKTGCMNLIIMMDNDEPGKIAANKIYNRTKDFYNVKCLFTNTNDIADLGVDQIRKDIVPLL